MIAVALCVLFGVSSRTADALLPGWSYELVSPPDTLGSDLDSGTGSADGDHAWLETLMPVSPLGGTGNPSALALTRTSSGWVAQGLTDPAAPSDFTATLTARSADSRSVIIARCPETLIACSGDPMTWERVDTTTGQRTPMFQVPYARGVLSPGFAGVSDDLTRLFISNPDTREPLIPGIDVHTAGHGLYVSHNGQLEFLGYDQDGAVLPCGAELAKDSHGTGFEQNGISADGLTVAFESPDRDTSCTAPVDVYVRRDGVSHNISRPRNGHPDLGASYRGSSRDGSIAYFTTASQLVSEDTDAHVDLYRYDISDDSVMRVTGGGDVTAVAVSPNGDFVYFITPDVLDGHGQSGEANLFAAHDGLIDYIATGADGTISLGGEVGGFGFSPITPDGRHIVFPSSSALTGQPTGGQNQLFRYSADDGSLVCVSCSPDGSPPAAAATFASSSLLTNADHRMQSDDGRTVVFQTTSSLLPHDVNAGVRDVYMWRDGELSLISSGRSPAPSTLVSTDAAGSNVFFISTARLLPSVDQDNRKLYDARLGGGSPTPAAASCAEAICRRTTPNFSPPIPPSETFAAPLKIHIRLGAIDRATLRRLASSGKASVRLTVTGPGRFRVRLQARIRAEWRTSSSASIAARRAGSFRVSLGLSRTARLALRKRGTLRLRITVSGPEGASLQRRITLRSGAR